MIAPLICGATTIESVTQQFAGGDSQRVFGSLNELNGLLAGSPEMPSVPTGGFSSPSLPGLGGRQ